MAKPFLNHVNTSRQTGHQHFQVLYQLLGVGTSNTSRNVQVLLLECLVSFGGKSAKELCGRGAMSVIITVCVRISFVNRSKSLVFHFCLVFITTLSSREQPLVPVGPTDRRCSYVSPIILAVANNYFRGGATVRGEKQTKFYCGKGVFFKMCGVDSCIFYALFYNTFRQISGTF